MPPTPCPVAYRSPHRVLNFHCPIAFHCPVACHPCHCPLSTITALYVPPRPSSTCHHCRPLHATTAAPYVPPLPAWCSCPRPAPTCFAHHQHVPTRPLALTMHTAHPGHLHRVPVAPMPHRRVTAPTDASRPSPTCPWPHLRPSRKPNHAMCPPTLAHHPCVLPPACHIGPTPSPYSTLINHHHPR